MPLHRHPLKYANCWEDVDLLLSRVGDVRGQRVLSICSGGENSLSLLCRQPDLLVVVDRSPVQLFLFELKKAAIRTLERSECLAFLGYAESSVRWRTYGQLRGVLGSRARAYWDSQHSRLERGVIHTGRVERTLRFLSAFVLPLAHDAASSRDLIAPKSASEQAHFFQTRWDNRRWRGMAHALFGKPAIFAVSPEWDFFKYHSGSGIAAHLLENTARHFSSATAQENHILHYFLFGHFGDRLPHFAREANYETIRANLDAAVTHEGLVETAPPVFGTFDAFNLSNIFEYTTPGSFVDLADAMAAAANPGARFCYWNILVTRRLSETRPESFRSVADTGRDPAADDKGWFYTRFVVDERTSAA